MSDLRNEMLRYLRANGSGDGVFSTAVEGLTLLRMSNKTLPQYLVYQPELCVVVQGAKSVMLGDAVIDYGVMEALVVSMAIPGVGQITKASVEEPLLVLTLQLDLPLLNSVISELFKPSQRQAEGGLSVYVHSVSSPLADCLARLVHMLSSPADLPFLLPLLLREIYYRLLTGENGDQLMRLGFFDSHTRRITEALHLLRGDFARPVLIEELAEVAGMSASSFHHHFKALTSMSPLHYQKRLRLLEAKRLMVSDKANASSAAFHVGYESVSQFSREYARMFGQPPKRDVENMRKLFQFHEPGL